MSIADHHPEGLQFLLRPHAQCSGMLCGAVMSAYHTRCAARTAGAKNLEWR